MWLSSISYINIPKQKCRNLAELFVRQLTNELTNQQANATTTTTNREEKQNHICSLPRHCYELKHYRLLVYIALLVYCLRTWILVFADECNCMSPQCFFVVVQSNSIVAHKKQYNYICYTATSTALTLQTRANICNLNFIFESF